MIRAAPWLLLTAVLACTAAAYRPALAGPFVLDDSRFRAAFGAAEPVPHREAVKRTVEWFTARRRTRG